MHELSIALSILEIAAEEADRRGGALVKAIHLRLGPLSGVVAEALVSAYELARESSPFPESVLVIDEVPLKTFCAMCQQDRFVVSIQQMCCPECGAPAIDIKGGDELEITAMAIQDPLPGGQSSLLQSKSSSHAN